MDGIASFSATLPVHKQPLAKGRETAKSARYMGNGLYRATLDIRSIDTHHETSAELSKQPGHDGITSRYLLPVHMRSTPEGAKSVDFVTESAPYTCGFGHQIHRDTS